MEKILLWFGLVVLAFGSVAAFELHQFAITDTSVGPQQQLTRITVDNVPLMVSIADTAQKQEQGLSGTDSLPPDQGMLFRFGQDGDYAFWMKDMKYSLDIIWLDDAGRIVYMQQNATPASFPLTFKPNRPARFVLEVNAGFANAHGVKIGDVVHFQ